MLGGLLTLISQEQKTLLNTRGSSKYMNKKKALGYTEI
jgi:hypothetical protein